MCVKNSTIFSVKKFNFEAGIDSSVSRTVEQLFPISARFSSGISDVIDSHILERNKYQSKFPLLTTYPSTETSIKGQGELNYNWRIGHAPVGWTETNVSGTAGTTQGDSCLWQKERNIRKIIEKVDLGEKIIKNGNLDNFGELLNEMWIEKKDLSRSISNSKIDELYKLCLENGALGGKLLGAGGGGFLLIYIKNEKKKKILSKLKNIINIPFKFSEGGCEVILNTLKK